MRFLLFLSILVLTQATDPITITLPMGLPFDIKTGKNVLQDGVVVGTVANDVSGTMESTSFQLNPISSLQSGSPLTIQYEVGPYSWGETFANYDERWQSPSYGQADHIPDITLEIFVEGKTTFQQQKSGMLSNFNYNRNADEIQWSSKIPHSIGQIADLWRRQINDFRNHPTLYPGTTPSTWYGDAAGVETGDMKGASVDVSFTVDPDFPQSGKDENGDASLLDTATIIFRNTKPFTIKIAKPLVLSNNRGVIQPSTVTATGTTTDHTFNANEWSQPPPVTTTTTTEAPTTTTTTSSPVGGPSPSPPPTTTAPPVSDEEEGLGVGAIVGISVGSVAVVGLGVWFYFSRRSTQVPYTPLREPRNDIIT